MKQRTYQYLFSQFLFLNRSKHLWISDCYSNYTVKMLVVSIDHQQQFHHFPQSVVI
jgi:hypothetical protein